MATSKSPDRSPPTSYRAILQYKIVPANLTPRKANATGGPKKSAAMPPAKKDDSEDEMPDSSDDEEAQKKPPVVPPVKLPKAAAPGADEAVTAPLLEAGAPSSDAADSAKPTTPRDKFREKSKTSKPTTPREPPTPTAAAPAPSAAAAPAASGPSAAEPIALAKEVGGAAVSELTKVRLPTAEERASTVAVAKAQAEEAAAAAKSFMDDAMSELPTKKADTAKMESYIDELAKNNAAAGAAASVLKPCILAIIKVFLTVWPWVSFIFRSVRPRAHPSAQLPHPSAHLPHTYPPRIRRTSADAGTRRRITQLRSPHFAARCPPSSRPVCPSSHLPSRYGSRFYELLPKNLTIMAFGAALCYFGGKYTASIAAVEAFRTMGWDRARADIETLGADIDRVQAANLEDDAKDDDGDGVADVDQVSPAELMQRKLFLIMHTIAEPGRIQSAIGSVYVALLAVLATLRMEFAASTAIALGIVDIVKFPAVRMLSSPVLSLVGVELKHWVNPIIEAALALTIIVMCAGRCVTATHLPTHLPISPHISPYLPSSPGPPSPSSSCAGRQLDIRRHVLRINARRAPVCRRALRHPRRAGASSPHISPHLPISPIRGLECPSLALLIADHHSP